MGDMCVCMCVRLPSMLCTQSKWRNLIALLSHTDVGWHVSADAYLFPPHLCVHVVWHGSGNSIKICLWNARRLIESNPSNVPGRVRPDFGNEFASACVSFYVDISRFWLWSNRDRPFLMWLPKRIRAKSPYQRINLIENTKRITIHVKVGWN